MFLDTLLYTLKTKLALFYRFDLGNLFKTLSKYNCRILKKFLITILK